MNRRHRGFEFGREPVGFYRPVVWVRHKVEGCIGRRHPAEEQVRPFHADQALAEAMGRSQASLGQGGYQLRSRVRSREGGLA